MLVMLVMPAPPLRWTGAELDLLTAVFVLGAIAMCAAVAWAARRTRPHGPGPADAPRPEPLPRWCKTETAAWRVLALRHGHALVQPEAYWINMTADSARWRTDGSPVLVQVLGPATLCLGHRYRRDQASPPRLQWELLSL